MARRSEGQLAHAAPHHGPVRMGNWSVGAIVVGVIASVLWIASLFSRPTFTVVGHQVVVTQGILTGVILFGALFWSVVEVFTPPGENLLDLLWRVLAGFILGGLFGGLFAYEFNLGAYLIVPAMNGNGAAIFELIALFVLGIVLIWDAAWSHTRSYRARVM